MASFDALNTRLRRGWAWIFGSTDRRKGTAVFNLLTVTALVGFTVGGTVLVMVLDRRSSYPVEEMRGGTVWIERRISPDIFKAFVRDPDTKLWNAWTFNSCKDYPITKEIQAGVTLCVLKYEVRPGCMSVAKHNLGYILWRDDNDKPILTAYAGQAATPCTTETTRTAETAEARAGR